MKTKKRTYVRTQKRTKPRTRQTVAGAGALYGHNGVLSIRKDKIDASYGYSFDPMKRYRFVADKKAGGELIGVALVECDEYYGLRVHEAGNRISLSAQRFCRFHKLPGDALHFQSAKVVRTNTLYLTI